ncbi:MAG: FAD:protein FMN transferase [Deltaproteobacteria bacterium]|nr:FAD:protein FMN transferase [Deltaproteobacteria bacterium]
MKKTDILFSRRQFLKVLSVGIGTGALAAGGLWRWRSLAPMSVVQKTRPLLGTFFTITVHDSDEAMAEKAVEYAFAAVEMVDRVMSIHRFDSDLSRVNATAGNDMVSVDPYLIDILKMTQQFHGLTGGVYDVTCLPLLQLYGFYQSQTENLHYPSDRKIYEILSVIDQKQITLDEKSNRVGLARAKAGIDLGSIGKGYAVDRAGDVLKSFGIKNALIDAGGNVLAMGAPHGDKNSAKGWHVAIRNPEVQNKEAYFEMLTLKDEAVATSGNYEQSLWLDGQRVGHLFDAKKGKPSDPLLSATAVAKNATLADGLSTSVFLLGKAGASRFKEIAKDIYYHSEDS